MSEHSDVSALFWHSFHWLEEEEGQEGETRKMKEEKEEEKER